MKDQLRLLRDWWQLLINEVKAYQLESPATVKLPKLSPTEMELVREEMNKR